MRTLRSILCLLALSLLTIPARAQASRTVTRTLDLPAGGHLTLDTFSGAVDVTTWDRPTVQLEVRFEDDDAELVENTRLVIDASGDHLEISEEVEETDGGFLSGLFDFMDDGGDHPSAYYTIRMPRTAALAIDAFSSDLRVENLRADLTLDLYSGDAQINGLRGRLAAETFSGDLTAEHVRGSADVEVYSGDVEIAFRRHTGASTFESFSGDVTLYLPEDAGLELTADLGMSGDFESDFATDALRTDEEVLRGIVGAGGPSLRFETFSGDLTLRSQ